MLKGGSRGAVVSGQWSVRGGAGGGAMGVVLSRVPGFSWGCGRPFWQVAFLGPKSRFFGMRLLIRKNRVLAQSPYAFAPPALPKKMATPFRGAGSEQAANRGVPAGRAGRWWLRWWVVVSRSGGGGHARCHLRRQGSSMAVFAQAAPTCRGCCGGEDSWSLTGGEIWTCGVVTPV